PPVAGRPAEATLAVPAARSVFLGEGGGGLALHGELLAGAAAGRKPKPEEFDRIALAAYAAAVVAELAPAAAPRRNDSARRDWMTFAEDMRVSAVALTDAARARKAEQARSAARRLQASCANCHQLSAEIGGWQVLG